MYVILLLTRHGIILTEPCPILVKVIVWHRGIANFVNTITVPYQLSVIAFYHNDPVTPWELLISLSLTRYQ